MFYVKEKINDELTFTVEIDDENVFTICPECGEEHAVDLSEIFSSGQCDLFSTAVYCRSCSEKRANKKKNA